MLPIRQLDGKIGLTQALAGAAGDPRDPERTEHAFLGMVRASVYGMLALRRRDGPAFRDRAVGVAVAKPEVARFGLIDMRAQAGVLSARRTDTPA